MSTNYFNPITYIPRAPTQTPVRLPNQTSVTLPTANPNWTTVTGYSPIGPNNQAAAPNQGNIASLAAGLYGSGTPGQPGYVPGLNERVATQLGQARNNARDALRGFGGVSFRADDTSTPNVDESLMMDYRPDQLGRNERQAVLSARAQANARGMLSSGFADQMVGSALQRVGEQARAIVNQYSNQINEIANRNFDPLTGLAVQTLGQIQSLYGADTQWAATQELQRPAPTPPASEPASQPTPAQAATTPAEFMAVGQAGGYGSLAWTGTTNPNMNSIRSRFPGMITTSFRGPDGKYYVYVRSMDQLPGSSAPAATAPSPPSAPARASGTDLWTGRSQPTTTWADSQFGPGNYRIVQESQIVNGRRVPKWVVRSR